MRTVTRLFPATLFVLACSTPAAAPAGLTDADRDAIRGNLASFVTGVNAKDWPAATANFSDDALFLPPNQTEVSGKVNIQAWMAAYPPFSNFTAQSVELEGSGDVAYNRGVYELDVTPPGATAAVHEKGKFLEIWRKQADGSWKLVRDIFNSDIPMAVPPPAK